MSPPAGKSLLGNVERLHEGVSIVKTAMDKQPAASREQASAKYGIKYANLRDAQHQLDAIVAQMRRIAATERNVLCEQRARLGDESITLEKVQAHIDAAVRRAAKHDAGIRDGLEKTCELLDGLTADAMRDLQDLIGQCRESCMLAAVTAVAAVASVASAGAAGASAAAAPATTAVATASAVGFATAVATEAGAGTAVAMTLCPWLVLPVVVAGAAGAAVAAAMPSAAAQTAAAAAKAAETLAARQAAAEGANLDGGEGPQQLRPHFPVACGRVQELADRERREARHD